MVDISFLKKKSGRKNYKTREYKFYFWEGVDSVEIKIAAVIEFYASANFLEVISVTPFDKSRDGRTLCEL